MLKHILLWLLVLLAYRSVSCAFCGRSLYTSDSDSISIQTYGSGIDCEYKINLKEKKRWIRLQWSWFNVDGDMPTCNNYVKVYTGCNGEKKVAKFCSNNMVSSLPHDIYSKDGCMRIKLSTTKGSNKGSNSGFRASYTSGIGIINRESSDCFRKTIKDPSGVITSPNWPENYNDFIHKGQCEQIISRNPDEFIQLNFMDFNIGYKRFCQSPYGYLELEARNDYRTEKVNPKYCQFNSPLTTMNTKFHKLAVILHYPFYPYDHDEGFAVGFVTYKNSKKIRSKITSIAGGIIGTVIIILVISIVIEKKRHTDRTRPTTLDTNPSSGLVINQTDNSEHSAVPESTQQPYSFNQQMYNNLLKPPPYQKSYPNIAPPPYDAVIENSPSPQQQPSPQSTSYPPDIANDQQTVSLSTTT